MLRAIHRELVKQWLGRFGKASAPMSGVRAVFLGDVVSTRVILDGMYEKYELQALCQSVFSQLDPDSACLDVGANIGNHARYFSGFFKRVIAFEPNPMVHAVLVANTLGCNITPVCKGLSDTSQKLSFFQDYDNLGASRIVKDDGAANASIYVTPLDDLVDDYDLSDVSFVKIDVENHELEMLRGARRFLAKNKPVLAMEAFFASHPERGAQVDDLLKTLGYRHFYRLAPRSELVRRLEGSFLNPRKGILRILLPEKMRKTMKLVEIPEALGWDHALLIISEKPLLETP